MIKYKAMFEKIQAVEVVRETEHKVVLPARVSGGKESMELKRSDWYSWHDTWDAAHGYLVEQAEQRVKSLRLQLERANGRLGQIKGMKKPEGVA